MADKDKVDRMLDIVEAGKNDKGWTRILDWMERHPILATIAIYFLVSKISSAVKHKVVSYE